MSTAYYPAGCFGKLPHFGDFVRHNAASREARAFDQWIQEGLYFAKGRMRQEWGQAFRSSSPYHFVFHPETADRFLVGILQPSHDKGEREYPFLVFVQVDRPRFGSGMTLIPIAFDSFFAGARALISRANNGVEMRQIPEQVEELNVSLAVTARSAEREFDDWISMTTVGQLFTELFGGFEDPRKFLLFRNLTEILEPLRQRGASRFPLGLRFPLSTGRVGYEASFWIELSMSILGNPAIAPVYFWTAAHDGRPAYLYLFFRQPSSRALTQLVNPALDNDNICELDEEGAANIGGAAGALPMEYRSLLEKPDTRLQELLIDG